MSNLATRRMRDSAIGFRGQPIVKACADVLASNRIERGETKLSRSTSLSPARPLVEETGNGLACAIPEIRRRPGDLASLAGRGDRGRLQSDRRGLRGFWHWDRGVVRFRRSRAHRPHLCHLGKTQSPVRHNARLNAGGGDNPSSTGLPEPTPVSSLPHVQGAPRYTARYVRCGSGRATQRAFARSGPRASARSGPWANARFDPRTRARSGAQASARSVAQASARSGCRASAPSSPRASAR